MVRERQGASLVVVRAYQILKVAGADVKQLLSMNACTPENFNAAREKGEDIFDGVGLGPVVKHYKKEAV